jgi:two-component system LytT family response regulator
MKLRVLIADDELLSRERLRQFLRAEPGTELVAECSNGIEAVNAIQHNSPDLVFLDIKMPELDGFKVIEALNGTLLPAVIFVTAYDQFALQAFAIHAVDYLLKPFDRDRFRMALERARQRLQTGSGVHRASSLSDLLTSFKATLTPLERVTMKSTDGRIKFVRIAEVDWISAAHNYVELYVGKTSHLLRITITALASQLPPSRFVRISRSVLVNPDRIKEISPKSHGDYSIILHNGTCLPGSRNYRNGLAALLGKSR